MADDSSQQDEFRTRPPYNPLINITHSKPVLVEEQVTTYFIDDGQDMD